MLLVVNSHIKAREVKDSPVGDSEILIVKVNPSLGSKILFVTCYNPPSASVCNFSSHLDNIAAQLKYTQKYVFWVILICLM